MFATAVGTKSVESGIAEMTCHKGAFGMRSPLKMTDFMQLTCDARPSTDLEGALHHMRFFAVSDESHQYEECPDVEAWLIFRSERLIEERN